MTAFDFPGFARLCLDTPSAAFCCVNGGQGPAVLLLHGYLQTHLAWRRISPKLAGTYRVVVLDLPGYGASRQLDQAARGGGLAEAEAEAEGRHRARDLRYGWP